VEEKKLVNYKLRLSQVFDSMMTIGASKLNIDRGVFLGKAINLLFIVIEELQASKGYKLAIIDETNTPIKVISSIFPDEK
jgi:L-rhamnose mutarotase